MSRRDAEGADFSAGRGLGYGEAERPEEYNLERQQAVAGVPNSFGAKKYRNLLPNVSS